MTSVCTATAGEHVPDLILLPRRQEEEYFASDVALSCLTWLYMAMSGSSPRGFPCLGPLIGRFTCAEHEMGARTVSSKYMHLNTNGGG